jgi:hypothetical protein
MSATVKAEHAYNLILKHKCIYWTVKTTDKGLQFAEQQQEVSPAESAQLLREALESISARAVLVELRPKTRKATGGAEGTRGGDVKTGFFNLIVDTSASLPANERSGASIYGISQFEEILKREQTISQMKIEALEKEHQASQEKSSPIMRLIEKFVDNEPLIAAVADKLIAAFTLPQARPAVSQAPKQIDNTLTRLKALDADYENTLFYMVQYLEDNPGVIDQVKTMFTPK